jgi:hypothetical protein
MRSRLLLGAAALLVFMVVPVALAQSDGDPLATASASVKKKVKKLNKRVKALEQRQGQSEAEQGDPRPPTGPAGGDLTGNYPNPDLAPGAVTGADIADNSLTGLQIDESTLGQVPNAANAANSTNATNATNATNVNGLQARAFHYAENLNTGNESFLSLGGLVMFALCEADGDIQITAGTTANNSYIRASNGEADAGFNTNEALDIDDAANNGVVTVAYREGPAAAGSTTFDSNSVTATLGFDESAGSPNCIASGTAMGRP